MFEKVGDPDFTAGEHDVLRFWTERDVFRKLQAQNAEGPRWSFLDGPITANNPMGVHHAWGRTYKDVYQRYRAMTGHQLRYQNGFDCQGLWVEVEVEKELKLGSKNAIVDFGIDRFVRECKKRVLRFAARQTEQSVRLGYWMEWDDPDELRALADAIGGEQSAVSSQRSAEPFSRDSEKPFSGDPEGSASDDVPTHTYRTARGESVTAPAEQIAARLGCPEWGGSYFTFSTENNETIWTFLKKCFNRGKIYQGHDVMPWSGGGGSAYSQMEVADGRRLTTHRSCFVRFPVIDKRQSPPTAVGGSDPASADAGLCANEYLLIWTTTPWTLTSNVAAAVNPDLEYVKLRAKKDGAVYYFAKENLEYQRLGREFKEGFGRPEWQWPDGVPKLKTIAQIFKEQGGYEIEGTLKGEEMIGWRYAGPFDHLPAQDDGLTEAEKNRFYASQYTGGAAIQNVHARIAQRSVHDIATIDAERTGKSADELSQIFDDLWIVSHHKSDNRVHFFERLTELLRNMGLYWTMRIHLYEDADAPRKVLLTLADFGVSLGTTARVESYLSRLDGDLRTQDPSVAVELLVEFIREQPAIAQQIYQELCEIPNRSAKENHRVINGGTDSKGNALVVSGEGTGIVHIAPGCGDVDHMIGSRLFLPSIAPLKEDGTFDEGFGPFTGREAIDPDTAELVFEELKKKDLLVYVETYPHIYPHCWRTGDELVFRLVDEWFINMDWREEIMEVTRGIEWLPESINGQEREIEWLTNMRDWMISKKRFWGLALPIWVNADDPSDFEVIGSLDELRERAREVDAESAVASGSPLNGGWDAFEGHTPHRPWIDHVKIKSRRTGAVLSRIEDVGNPWLDAGITPFSTMHYNHDREEWAKWYPADFVTECFPGQFRNWFYSLLALSTMMRYDETDDPLEKRPFKTLLGHRLVMDEHGQPMHKSDGTAIWFEEAAEQLGVDTLRWLYCAQNPDADLRFGTRHPNEPVTLDTPEGPISRTKEGLPCCKVTSKPADEVRRQILIPLWNSYAFLVNYARLDEFDPSLEPVPVDERPEIDRWILSNLQAFLQTANDRFLHYDVAAVCSAAAAFIDDLSNWYIRRNRRRFWRSRAESQESRVKSREQSPSTAVGGSEPGWDADKLAAYQTMYTVLVDLTKALAPIVPFITERMYGNLVCGPWSVVRGDEADSATQTATDDGRRTTDVAESVHLCAYPQPDEALLKPELNRRTATAQRVVRMGHRLREEANLRVRQPLAELRYACRDDDAADIAALEDVIADELNVKSLMRVDNLDDLVRYAYKPNLKTLGPKYGKLLGVVRKELPELPGEMLAPLRSGQPVTVTVGGVEVTLEPDDVLISTEQASDWTCGDAGGIQLALSTQLTPELLREGMARDFVRHVQQARKDADLEITDRIRVFYATDSDESAAAINEWREYIANETLADAIEWEDEAAEGVREVSLGDAKAALWIRSV